MKAILCLLVVFVGAVHCFTPPSPPVVGDNWSFMGITEFYNKVNGSIEMNSGWYYGDSAKQVTGVILMARDYHIGLLEDPAKKEIFIADYNSLNCFTEKADDIFFVGPNFYSNFKFIGTMQKVEAPFCGKVDGFEQIKNDTVFQTWFVSGTNVPCFTHMESNDYLEDFWYVDFMYDTPFGANSFQETCPFNQQAAAVAPKVVRRAKALSTNMN